jgi:hypothetical protein
MAIALNLEELSADFEIPGVLKDVNSFVGLPFQREIGYFDFLIRRYSEPPCRWLFCYLKFKAG